MPRRGSPIYCGNNARDPDLRSGRKTKGTNNTCFKKGFGVGYYVLPFDNKYAGRYVPIDARKIYCGDKPNLPEGYDLKGNLANCYRIGVGAGRAKKAKEVRKNIPPSRTQSRRR